MTDLERVAALIDACRRDGGRLPKSSAAVFLALWDARGRTVSADYLADAVDTLLRREMPGDEALTHVLKRTRRAIEAAEWAVSIAAVYGIGWHLDVSPGWDWEAS